MKIRSIALSILLLVCSFDVMAGAPACHSSYDGFCEYKGKVHSLYINADGLILLYFDTLLPKGEEANAGLSVTDYSSAIVSLNGTPDFAKLFYSTALSAQASGREVTIQMRGTLAGRLKVDRIWIPE